MEEEQKPEASEGETPAKPEEPIEEEVKELEGKAEPAPKQEEAAPPKPRSLSPPVMMISAIAIALVLLVLVVVFVPEETEEPITEISDAQILDISYSAAENLITLAEGSAEIDIDTTAGVILSRDPYMISFPVKDSDVYKEFKIKLDAYFNLLEVGYDGDMMEPHLFYSITSVSNNMLRQCAEEFNTQEIIGNVVQRWYEAPAFTPGKELTFSISKYIQCGAIKFPYALEIGDGFVETVMINNVTVRTEFIEGVVVNGVKISREEIAAGAHLRILREEPEERTEVGPLSLDYRPAR